LAVFQGKVAALNRCGGKLICRWPIVLVISVPKIFVIAQLIIENVVRVFLGTRCRNLIINLHLLFSITNNKHTYTMIQKHIRKCSD